MVHFGYCQLSSGLPFQLVLRFQLDILQQVIWYGVTKRQNHI